MTRRRMTTLALAATMIAAGATASSAAASYHEIKVTEVHQGPGVPTVATGDYVELQMYSAGQQFVSGHYVAVYDGGSTPQAQFLLPTNVANGESQRTILVANDNSTPGADFTTGDFNVVNANGGACYLENLLGSGIDCVNWGSPVGTLSSPTGTPVALSGGDLDNNQSIHRVITKGCATALDPADDTNNGTDWVVGPPTPRGNAAAPTETPCKTAAPPKKKCKKKKGKKSAAAAAKKKCKKKKKKK